MCSHSHQPHRGATWLADDFKRIREQSGGATWLADDIKRIREQSGELHVVKMKRAKFKSVSLKVALLGGNKPCLYQLVAHRTRAQDTWKAQNRRLMDSMQLHGRFFFDHFLASAFLASSNQPFYFFVFQHISRVNDEQGNQMCMGMKTSASAAYTCTYTCRLPVLITA
jgi:hypothetical protein